MDLPFIDTHVHFWDRTRLNYDWLNELPAIAATHTPAELRAEAADRQPGKIVFVQAGGKTSEWLDEVKWVESLVEIEPRIAAVVAYAPMDLGEVTIAAIAELRRHRLVRGVRHLIQGESDPNFCVRPEFLTGVQALGDNDLSFDICCKHHQLASVVKLVRRCPHTNFILDHAGKPDLVAQQPEPWREHISQLAALPNVVCKLSGLITEADHAAWKIDDLRPPVAHLLTAFGPTRLMFGSDWPVVKLAGSYRRWLEVAEELTSTLAPFERSAIFRDNAVRVYRLF
ncbi:MAG TPA: amidohydrolase family protein [Candidatus Didemnitutus sp.]|nr:amidohydrolase family protein [Candidatus Didemnitutus sp.]